MAAVVSLADALETRLVALPIVADARVAFPSEGSVAVEAVLDAALVRARASQQGLADTSCEAAARCPRVQRMIADAVRAALDGAALTARVITCRVLAAPGRTAATLTIRAVGDGIQ